MYTRRRKIFPVLKASNFELFLVLLDENFGRKVNQPGWRIVAEERFAEALGFPPGDHPASPRRDRHGTGTAEDFQLDGGALDAGDAQRDPPVVDLVVAELLQQRVADLGQAEPLLALDHQRHDVNSVKGHGAHLQLLTV